ncbi:S-layer homology domain-containing protein [Cohnella cellulosilytica]|uniref:S-layer homology domain-containing protein n=1 Tax=Cohnella cellulosilytica TaxID=986710 RepID=A0ABW2FK97_9BACL
MNRLKVSLRVLLVLTFLFGLLSRAAPAVRADDGPVPSEELGWVLVSNAAELAYIDENQASYLDRNIRVTSDIDMTGYEWVPLGGNEVDPFSGVFDGRGHRIAGLSIDGGALQLVGFFGRLTGTVRDLSVSAQVSGGNYAGGLAGHLDGGEIVRSSAQGFVTAGNADMTGVSAAGGLAGMANGNSAISRSYSSAAVRSGEAGNQYAGGLVGSQGTGSISDAYAIGTVANSAGLYFTAGGLAGQLVYGTITNSYAAGAVEAAASSTYITMGGFVGSANFEGSIVASYFDTAATLQANGAGDSYGAAELQLTGRSTSDMMLQANYGEPGSDWDFANTWAVRPGVNAGYPYLRPYVLTTVLPRALKGAAYSQSLEAFDGAGGGLSWSASGLPEGVRMTAAGELEGIPSEAGTFPVTVTAADAGSTAADAALTLYVDETAPDIAGLDVAPGSALGSTRATVAASGSDRVLAYIVGDSAGVRPLSGAALPDEAVPYASGTDIFPVGAGQILQIYETDGEGRVWAWSSIRLEEFHLQDRAPETVGSVTGTVYGAGNAPLSGAAVSAGGIAGSTDVEGKFALHNVVPGTHTLSVSASGYRVYSATVNVAAGEAADAGRIKLIVASVPGSSGGSGSSGSSAPEQSQEASEITLKINGRDVRVSMKKERESDGRSVIRLALDDELLRSLFAAEDEVVISLDTEDPVVKADLPAAALLALARTRPDAVIRLEANGAEYGLPLRLWNGLSKDAATVTLSISKTTATEKEKLYEALTRQGYAVLAEPMDFSLRVDGTEWAGAGGAYTERTLSLTAEVDPDRSTVVWIDAAGRPHFVPSIFEQARAIFHTPHNSLYTVIGSDRTFRDTAGHWARTDIESLASKLIVSGTSSDTFEPDRTVTRAEFAAMLVRALGLEEKSGRAVYSDVRPAADWYSGAIGAASAAGLIEGYGDGTFRPNALVTREQAAVLLARAVEFAGELPPADAIGLDRFSDRPSIAGWAEDAAARLLAAGIVEGIGGAAFAPKQLATRAQSAVLLARALRYLNFIDGQSELE